MLLAATLHGIGTGDDQPEAVLEAHGTGGYQGTEFSKGMATHHVGHELAAHIGGKDDGVEENGRLGDFGLFQVFGGAGKHEVGDAEANNLVGLLKEVAAVLAVVV